MCVCSIRCQRSLSGQRGVDAVGISASMEGGTEVDDSRPDVRIPKSPVFILRCHLRHRLQAQRFRDLIEIGRVLLNASFIFHFYLLVRLHSVIAGIRFMSGEERGISSKSHVKEVRDVIWTLPWCHSQRNLCAALKMRIRKRFALQFCLTLFVCLDEVEPCFAPDCECQDCLWDAWQMPEKSCP